MLKLISCIKERLAEINDGNFVVEDLETERLKKFVIILTVFFAEPNLIVFLLKKAIKKGVNVKAERI